MSLISKRKIVALKSTLRAAHVGALILSLTVGPASAEAFKLTLKQGINARQYENDELKHPSFLGAGSEVEIPDQYIKRTGGQIDVEMTLNNWLSQAGSLAQSSETSAREGDPDRFRFDGNKFDYFFPVKVTKAVGKQPKDRNGSGVHYIALKYLARLKGRAFVVTETAPTYPEAPGAQASASSEALPEAMTPTTAANAENETNAETAAAPRTEVTATVETAPASGTPEQDRREEVAAQIPCATGNCAEAGPLTASQLDAQKKLRDAVARLEDEADKRTAGNSRRVQGDLDHFQANFKRTCGFPFKEFRPIIERETKAAGVPMHMILSKMLLESSGKCYLDNSEDNRTESRGLFGINTGSTTIKHDCSQAQRNIIRAMHPSQLASGPQCTQNPLLNLREAIRIYKQKLTTLDQGGFDFDEMSDTDESRLGVSAFNGGEKWVFRAKEDLEIFNRKWGTNYNAENWEDLRLFYFRSALNRQTEAYLFGSVRPQYVKVAGKKVLNRRGKDPMLTNLAYTESVVPRDRSQQASAVTPVVKLVDELMK